MRTLHFLAIALFAAAPALAGPTFSVTFDQSLRPDPATGRLVIYLVAEASGISGPPASGPFWEDPQPLYGVDVNQLAPGTAAEVTDAATSFPVALSKLPQGRYRVQAVLDLHQ